MIRLHEVRIETERLLLTPTTQDYAGEIFNEFTAEVTAFMFPKPAENLNETRRFIAESLRGLEAGTNLHMVILNKNTAEFLGCVGLHDIGSGCPEFGVWLKMAAHGNGFGFEAVSALKEWADKSLECEAYLYPVDSRNMPSKRIPQILGGKIIRRYSEDSMSGKTLHIVTYRIPAGGGTMAHDGEL